MRISRRSLLRSASIAAGAVAANSSLKVTSATQSGDTQGAQLPLPPAFDTLKPLGDRVKPITATEYQARIAHAKQLMGEAKPRFDALYVTPGTTLAYFTGIVWWPSERLLALLIPRQGDPLLICPGFEEGRLRELCRWPIDVRAWQEDESPYALGAKALADRGIRTGRVGVEETTRYAFYDGLRRADPSIEYVSADSITIGCRAQKSEHELELMRQACAATFAVYKATFASLREGMTQREVAQLVVRGYQKMGLEGEAQVFFGTSASLPHGSRQPQVVREGIGVLLDDGTSVEGYQSDVTRVKVLGKPPATLQRAFEIVRQAQDAALAAAVSGHTCGSVDDAARKVITDAGFGPGYKYFPHRVGHGIGMDGHEWPYLVHGNPTVLRSGMTFSDEPGIYVPGEYGMRCEDEMVVTGSGAAQLLTPGFAPSLENPIP